MNTNVLLAVFRRNFLSYFANPTGYVFICVFVSASTVAAFWPPDFFNNNLANLAQLNLWFPFIMLGFIPTITMSIWAEERKQGTDELLLTIPASDFDIVLGKYLAAVAIYSVSLLYSMFCSYFVLNNLASADSWIAVLPSLDLGLFIGTYIGYWLIGVAMLSIGVAASFLTSNLTIGFVLGVLFNLPLVFCVWADAIFGGFGQEFVLWVSQWSISRQFSDFGNGVLSFAGFTYYFTILAVMLYVSMVLIGRRHWFSGKHRWAHVWHYTIRALALLAIALGVVAIFQRHDLRLDVTTERLSSLSPRTVELIRDLKTERPVQIEAFISPSVPEAYVQTRMNLLTVLRELQALGGDKIRVVIHNTDRYSEEAALAEKRFGIEPRPITTINHGAMAMDSIFLNVAVKCGSQQVPPVFIDRGIPLEYELVRSICTVSEQKRKKLGVLKTDAELFGGFNMQAMSASPNWPIIDELQKQYEVVRVDPSKPITEKFDVLLAVQPSSLGPQEMENFVAAVENGQPTAVFEDPAPIFGAGVPATSAPRQAQGGNMFMRAPPSPKGDIAQLWRLLGVDFVPDRVVWQDYNPYPKATHFPKEFVFVDDGCVKEPFNQQDPISGGLQHVLFPFPGAFVKLNSSSLEFTPLVTTGEKTGYVSYKDILQMSPFGQRGGLNPNRRQLPTKENYVLAAHIQGKTRVTPPSEDPLNQPGQPKAEPPKPYYVNINVVVVADIDMLSQDFFRIREQGDIPEAGMHFDFDNVTFVLNTLDELANDQRFMDIRKRRPVHRTLKRIEERTKEARQDATASRERFVKEYDEAERQEDKQIADKIEEVKKRKNVDIQQMAIEVAMMQQDLERRKEARVEQARQKRDREVNKIETDLALKVRAVQDQYKLWAVFLLLITPLLVAIVVFFIRRAREREGVARSRLR